MLLLDNVGVRRVDLEELRLKKVKSLGIRSRSLKEGWGEETQRKQRVQKA